MVDIGLKYFVKCIFIWGFYKRKNVISICYRDDKLYYIGMLVLMKLFVLKFSI